MSRSTDDIKLFSRGNISEELINRFSTINAGSKRGGELSPTRKKVELEKLLLSVPLDDEVAGFSDTSSETTVSTTQRNLPLYNDTYEPSFCLPSSGYKSDSEKTNYRIRTCNSANQSPENSPPSRRRAEIRRTRSLNANTVTDRIWEIREKLASSKKKRDKSADKNENKSDNNNNNNFELRTSANTTTKFGTSVRRSRSFNLNPERDVTDTDKTTLLTRKNLKSSSVSQLGLRDINKLREYFGGNKWKRPTNSEQTTDTQEERSDRRRTTSQSDDITNTNLKSNSFCTLQDAWEQRGSLRTTQNRRFNPPGNIPSISTTRPSTSGTNDNEIIYRRKERRRLKREGLLANDRSDSETEGEDGQLTEAALQRLERRSKQALRRSNSFRRRGRLDSDSNDENNNETSSEKTLDSGVFEVTLSNLSEHISKLSKRYDSDDYILDDCISTRSGYSSATESLAESTTTFYDSADEDMDRNKKRSTRLKPKQANAAVKAAVLNSTASRLGKSTNKDALSTNATSPTSHTSHSNENTTPMTPISRKNQDLKTANKSADKNTKTNINTSTHNLSTKGTTVTADKNSVSSATSEQDIQTPTKENASKTISSALSKAEKRLSNSHIRPLTKTGTTDKGSASSEQTKPSPVKERLSRTVSTPLSKAEKRLSNSHTRAIGATSPADNSNTNSVITEQEIHTQVKDKLSRTLSTPPSKAEKRLSNSHTKAINIKEKIKSSEVNSEQDEEIPSSDNSSTTSSSPKSKAEKRLSNSHTKAINSKQSKESPSRKESLSSPQRKISVHHKGCIGEENMSNYANPYASHHHTTTKRKSSIGSAKRKESLQHKTAQICTSPTLSKTNEEKETVVSEPQGINEGDGQVNKQDKITDKNLIKTAELNRASNSISQNNHDKSSHKKTQDEQSVCKTVSDHSTDDDENKMDKVKNLQSKFIINHEGSSVDETKSRNRLVRQGESIEIKIALDSPSAAEENQSTKTPNSDKTPPPVKQKRGKEVVKSDEERGNKVSNPSSRATLYSATKPKSRITTGSQVESLHKGIQCLLLNGESKLSGKIINVSDTSKQVTVDESILTDLGADILQDIQFTYPTYLIPRDEEASLDCTDFPENTTSEKIDPVKVKMENVRLQQLLFDVEKARAGTVKALLHVNTLLNKVQGENTRLEGEIKVCTQEKDHLAENLKSVTDNPNYLEIKGEELALPGDNDVIKNRKGTIDRSLGIIVDSWKREKKELVEKLNKTKAKEEDAEKSASRLRVQYKKVKEQLEHSNNAFTMTLKNNLDATKRMEEELKNSLEEKQEMLKRCNEGNKFKRDLENVKQEMEELKASYEELEDEKEQLENKCKHLERQKQHLLNEEEELHEQIGHSQEIIGKLTNVEDELKEELHREVKEKEYLQEMLDETGQILYQLKHNERRLKEDKDTLLDDLEAELEEKQSLKTTLTVTIDEHKSLVDRLQNMTNIHITVKESLQQANKKEKNYQEHIEALTKTNHILHYTLEKEKEEKLDLQEMFDIIESDHKKFKSEITLKNRDLETRLDELRIENHNLTQMKDELAKKCDELQTNLDQEEENNAALRDKLTRAEQIKEVVENELHDLRDNGEEIERNLSGLTKKGQELEVDLKVERSKNEKLTVNIEETEAALDKVSRELSESKIKLNEYRCDYEDMQTKLKERHKRIRELESSLELATEQKDKYHNRMTYYETETKQLRKTVNEQTDQVGNLQIDVQRISRERDNHKRNCDMAVRDFEDHKVKCTDTLKKLKDEIIELGRKIIEKDRLTSKQREQYSQYNEHIDDTKADLQLIRNILDTNIKKRSIKQILNKNEDAESNNLDIDVNYLRSTHDKFRDEFQSHVEKLEEMLKHSKENDDTVTVVQSPMSKIKLEELKQIRNEVFDMHSELQAAKTKISNVTADVTSLKLSKPKPMATDEEFNKSVADLDSQLASLNELMSKLEIRHKAVMSRNAILLQRTLTEDDLTAKDLVKKFQVISLEGENKQLRTLLGILKKRYDFNEQELADELQNIQDEKASMLSLSNGISSYTNGSEPSASPQLPRKSMSPRVDNKPRRSNSRRSKNHSFNDDGEGNSPKPVRNYPRDHHLRSSGVSSYSSDDEDDFSPPRGLPKRYNSRTRRPRT